MADDLVQWLRAQLDEDERDAQNVHALDCELTMTAGFHGPCTCGRPARLLAEVDAKRRLIDLHQCAGRLTGDGYPEGGFAWCATCGSGEACEYPTEWPCVTLKLLALPYADRPGYLDEWKP